MEPRFYRSRFSKHFNHLTWLGMWSAEMLTNPVVKKLHLLCRLLWHGVLVTAIIVQMIDMYLVFGNLRKVTFNLCTSSIVVGYTFKIILLYDRKDSLNDLRLSLWQDSLHLSREETALRDTAYHRLNYIRNWFYTTCLLFLPIMIISSYFSYNWGPRELPFAGYFPMSDPLNDYTYVPALLFEAVAAFYVITVAMETELSFFSIVVQIDTYYEILIQNVMKINDTYKDEKDDKANELMKTCLGGKKGKAKELLGLSVVRHLELIEYVKKFEFIFNRCMLLHIITISSLIVMNGLELTLYLHKLSIKLCFQMAFTTLLIIDLLFLCHHLSRLSFQCTNMGKAAYSICWFKMDTDMKKRIFIIMICSKTPPRITAGKLFLMDLNTYLRTLKNIYSWLMLMRQLVAK